MAKRPCPFREFENVSEVSCFCFRALARLRLDSSISKLHRTRTKRLQKHVAVAWKNRSMGIWGPDQTTETTPKCDGNTYMYTYIYTYKHKPNAIHDYLPCAKALGNKGQLCVYLTVIKMTESRHTRSQDTCL